MKKRVKAFVALALSFALAVTMLNGYDASAKKKAKKPALSITKATIYKGSKKTVTIKNVKSKKIKSLKWSTKSKKIATVKKTSKTKASIKAVKAGKTTITCSFKYSGKKYKKTVKVTVKNKPVKKPVVVTPAPTEAPVVPVVTPTPAPAPEGKAPEVNLPDAAVAGGNVIYSEDFTDGTGKFTVRGPGDSKVKLESADYGFGGKCMFVKDRVDEAGEFKSWSGAQVSMKEIGAQPGKAYKVTAWAMAQMNIRDATQPLNDYKRGVVMSKIAEGSDDYSSSNVAETGWISNKFGVKWGTWVKLQATITMPTETDMFVYFETPGNPANGKSADFYIDSFSVQEITGKVDSSKLPSLADAYRGILNIGTAVGADQLRNKTIMQDVVRQFKSADPEVAALSGGSITLGNEMKPASILGGTPTLVDASEVEGLPASYKDAKVPVLNFDNIDESLKLAKQYGFMMRGHCLLWHQQTPDWFFAKDFNAIYDTNGKVMTEDNFVDEATMTGRLEWYIKSVLEHIQNAEGGEMVYCWDVVNEAVKTSGSSATRDFIPNATAAEAGNSSNWAKIYGNGSYTYIVNAFKFARQYATPGVELYYNDYNEYETAKNAGICKIVDEIQKVGDYIDGIGMQMHLKYQNPTVAAVGTAIDNFAAKGMKVQITELDMTHAGTETSAQFAAAYRDLFELFVEKKDKLDMIVLWGIDDETSWRSDGYPTLFRAGFQPKMAFWEVLNAGLVANGKDEIAYTADDYYLDKAKIE